MKVPAQSGDSPGSVGSEGQTSFGADNMLWTPEMDKRLPSLAEQQIMAVAKATRAQIAAKDLWR